MLWSPPGWGLSGLRVGHMAAIVSSVRPTLANTVFRDSSGQRFWLAPGWTLLSPQSWAIGFVLEWEFASGFIGWTFSNCEWVQLSLGSLRKCLLGDRRNFPGQWLREWNGHRSASEVEFRTETGRPSQRTQVDLTLPTPGVWVISLIFDCCREDWNKASAMFLVNSGVQSADLWPNTWTFQLLGCVYLMLDPQTNRSLWLGPKGTCAVLGSEASYSLWIYHWTRF